MGASAVRALRTSIENWRMPEITDYVSESIERVRNFPNEHDVPS
jgi:hypothetical protein